MKDKLEVLFSGRVQGVGFRYTTFELSRKYPITGFVKNLPDGKVQLIISGKKEELQSFLQDILNSRLNKNIQKYYSSWTQSDQEFSNFEIR